MQTLTELARMVVKWERRSLPNGAYRVSAIQVLENTVPTLVQKYDNCSYDWLFHDELTCVKEVMNLSAGVWVGMMLELDGVTKVLALQME